MPRLARTVFANIPHHITQRGKKKGNVPLFSECNQADTELLGTRVEKGLPCGANGFIEKLEKIAGHGLRYKPQGRPKKG